MCIYNIYIQNYMHVYNLTATSRGTEGTKTELIIVITEWLPQEKE